MEIKQYFKKFVFNEHILSNFEDFLTNVLLTVCVWLDHAWLWNTRYKWRYWYLMQLCYGNGWYISKTISCIKKVSQYSLLLSDFYSQSFRSMQLMCLWKIIAWNKNTFTMTYWHSVGIKLPIYVIKDILNITYSSMCYVEVIL